MRKLTGIWTEAVGISSVEYAILLAMIAGGIVIAVDALSDIVEIQFIRKATCLRDSTSVYLDPACDN